MSNLKFVGINKSIINKLEKYNPFDKVGRAIYFVDESKDIEATENDILIYMNSEYLENKKEHDSFLFEFGSPRVSKVKNPQLHTLPILYSLFPINSFLSDINIVIRYPGDLVPKGDICRELFFHQMYATEGSEFIKEVNQLLCREVKSNFLFTNTLESKMKIKIIGKKNTNIKIYDYLSNLYKTKSNINVIDNLDQRSNANDKLDMLVEETQNSVNIFLYLDPLTFNLINLFSLLDNMIG